MLNTDDTKTAERHFTVTPLDLRQTQFKTAIRGFDREDVAAFLLEAADDYEHALRENERLRQELVRFDAALNQHRELEGSLKNTLVSAQKVADDMRESANQEAERIVRDAENRAELTFEESQARLKQVQREIDGLRLNRLDVETSVEATISTLRNALEIVREQDQRQEKVVPHYPRVDLASRAV